MNKTERKLIFQPNQPMKTEKMFFSPRNRPIKIQSKLDFRDIVSGRPIHNHPKSAFRMICDHKPRGTFMQPYDKVHQVTVRTIMQPKFLSTRLQRTLQNTVGLYQNHTWPLDHLHFTATNDARDQWTANIEEARRYAYRTDATDLKYYSQIFDHYQGPIYKTDVHDDDERNYNVKKSYLQQVRNPNSFESTRRGPFINDSSPRKEATSRQSPKMGQFIKESSPRRDAISRLRPNHRRHWGEHELETTLNNDG
jgi:hypothetical protein